LNDEFNDSRFRRGYGGQVGGLVSAARGLSENGMTTGKK
jgi:hypothetical protein